MTCPQTGAVVVSTFAVLRQLDANGAKSTTPAGQCRLTPLIPLILDSSFLYHFSVRLMFKLHSREWKPLLCLIPPWQVQL